MHPSKTSKSVMLRKFCQQPQYTCRSRDEGKVHNDLPLGGEACDSSKKTGKRKTLNHKQGRAANRKAAAKRKSEAMHGQLCRAFAKKKRKWGQKGQKCGLILRPWTINSRRPRTIPKDYVSIA